VMSPMHGDPAPQVASEDDADLTGLATATEEVVVGTTATLEVVGTMMGTEMVGVGVGMTTMELEELEEEGAT
jgi:hypothetical protein